MKLEYGKYSHDFESLPEATRLAIIGRGVRAVMSNEVASTVGMRIAKTLWPSEDGKGLADSAPEGAERTVAIKSFRATNADLVNGWNAEEQDASWAEILEGKLGLSTRGPSVDPVEARARVLARKAVVDTLKENGIKVPKKADQTVEFADGTKKTVAMMVESRLAHPKHGPEIRKSAEKIVAEEARAAKRAAEASKAAESKSAADLGL